MAIQKSVRSALRFFNELRKEALAKSEPIEPPSYEDFASMARNLMEATKRVDLGRLRNVSMRELFERTWSQKLLNYSTQRQLKEAYEVLLRRF